MANLLAWEFNKLGERINGNTGQANDQSSMLGGMYQALESAIKSDEYAVLFTVESENGSNWGNRYELVSFTSDYDLQFCYALLTTTERGDKFASCPFPEGTPISVMKGYLLGQLDMVAELVANEIICE